MNIDSVRIAADKYLEMFAGQVSKDEIHQLLHVIDDQPHNSIGYIIPTQKLALYLMERIFYLPKILPYFELRTNLKVFLLDKFPNFSKTITLKWLTVRIKNYYDTQIKSETEIDKLYKLATEFLNLFLQLANPNRRYAELTFGFIYKKTPKFETLLKMFNSGRTINFVISMPIEGTEYCMLVFDTTRDENILAKLPYQFLKPKIAILITDFPQRSDIDYYDFDPEFMLIVGHQYFSSGHKKYAYYLPYVNQDFSYFLDTFSDNPINIYNVTF